MATPDDRRRAHYYATMFPGWANVMNYHHDVIDRLTDEQCAQIVAQAIAENGVTVDYSISPARRSAR